MKKLFATAFLILQSIVSFAHEGHHHTPGAVVAPHGGVLQDLKHMYLELVVEAGTVTLYPLDHDLKSLATKDVTIEASVKYPKKPKPESVAFSSEGDAFKAVIDAKGAHRYSLEVKISAQGKTSTAKFNVEPQ